jgi:anti-sigma factor ChrR (cupin superfamily)
MTTASWSQRLAMRAHLMMCGRCSTFKRWMDAIAGSARALTRAAEHEAPADLEARTLRRLERST